MNFLHFGSAKVTMRRTTEAVDKIQECRAALGFRPEAARAWRRVEIELHRAEVSFPAAKIGFKYDQLFHKRTLLFIRCKRFAGAFVGYVYDVCKFGTYCITPGDSSLDLPLSTLARLFVDRVLKKHWRKFFGVDNVMYRANHCKL